MVVKDQKLKYLLAGDGEMIVLLPPPLCDHKVYCKIQRKLSQYYRTVSIDLPQTNSLESAIEIMTSALKIGTKKQFHLVASSATGWIAQYLVPRLNGKVKSLILINSFFSNKKYGNSYKFALKSTKLVPGFKFRKEVIKQSKKLLSGISDKDIKKYFKNRVEELGKSKIREQLFWFIENLENPKRLTLPILLFLPSKDPILSSSDYNQLYKTHKDVEKMEIDTSTHLFFFNNQDLLVKKISSFIEKNFL